MTKPFYEDLHSTLYNQDFRTNDLPDESVQCVVTSPPYWGLRKYSGEQELIWGGDSTCEHQWKSIVRHRTAGGPQVPDTKWQSNISLMEGQRDTHSNTCSLCGAWKGAYGLEPQPDCGRPFAKLRSDLTEKELEYIMGELKRCGLL